MAIIDDAADAAALAILKKVEQAASATSSVEVLKRCAEAYALVASSGRRKGAVEAD
ncbi:hypothetical protein R8Z50_20165 [Longispora sp. K20-0274]|uniref:hypothetical protein n=1 Tax=Longispora sp. K20-0274 TaxID=3088255 RepID=UPI00399984EA